MEISPQGEDEKTLLENSSEQSSPPGSPNLDDILGEQELFPRVGDKYQAEIPPMLSPPDQLKYLASPCDLDFTVDGSLRFLVGLPVQITQAYDQAKGKQDGRAKCCANEAYSDLEYKEPFKEFSSDLDKELNEKVDCMDLKSVTTSYGLVPGSSSEPWSDFEIDCFLLGLYICGKNLLQVKRFVESKEVGQLLSFYYGRFYGSSKYKGWSDCRKVKGKKGIIGQRLMSGGRQQELVSRLHMSDESGNSLLEASKAFADGRSSLEEYVSIVKSLVSINALVEAFKIGKGKEDLILMAMESSKHNQALSSRPDMPSGRACSSLTYAEIVKYLIGDFRLSKARSNDLFWEAVWPRLLAKGWHSEEPKDKGGYKGSRNWLVFLVPGVKKFRRKLSKGADYFDSATDVLKRVASEPELFMLEAEENNWQSESKKEHGCMSGPNSDEDDRQVHQHHQYLKPRFSTDLCNHAKFTIIDTTLVDGDETSKVRELKTLPFEVKKTFSLQKKRSREAEVSSGGNKVGNLEDANNLFNTAKESLSSNPLKGSSSCSCGGKVESSGQSGKPVKRKHMNCNVTSIDASHLGDCQAKSNQSHHFGPVVKRRRLSACSKAVTRSMAPKGSSRRRKREHCCVLSLPATSGKDVPASPKYGVVSSITRSSDVEIPWNGEQNKIHGERTIEHGGTVDQSREHYDITNFQSQPMVSLNGLEPPTQTEIPRALKVGMEEDSHHQCVITLDATYENVESSESVAGSCRRHGSRNRPMSTKALEALESSFFSPKLSRKRGSPTRGIEDDNKPRAFRKARSKSSDVSSGNYSVEAAVRDSEAIGGTTAMEMDTLSVSDPHT